MKSEGTDHLPFSKWIMRPETLVGLSALLLSLCGLFTAIYQASLFRQAQRASVWPYVEVGGTINRSRIDLRVNNTGVGPARVRAAAVTYKGELLANWEELVLSVAGDDSTRYRINIYQSRLNNRVLATDARAETFFRVVADSVSASPAFVSSLKDAIDGGQVDVAVCYCSVYEECWTSNLQTGGKARHGGEIPSESNEVDGCDSMERSGI